MKRIKTYTSIQEPKIYVLVILIQCSKEPKIIELTRKLLTELKDEMVKELSILFWYPILYFSMLEIFMTASRRCNVPNKPILWTKLQYHYKPFIALASASQYWQRFVS